ncbi:hypothetical protein LMG29542_08684 [Paraburkholderia humisilvae]|uniref:Uncharacterized protein n=1 Tax=Paraburkholderia humisilvae TaxID=627669 RepID=A0A6J5FC44_9BURK|nr:hypothetical protein LMG29542_08684 [Paraburkholderia humisilvae]
MIYGKVNNCERISSRSDLLRWIIESRTRAVPRVPIPHANRGVKTSARNSAARGGATYVPMTALGCGLCHYGHASAMNGSSGVAQGTTACRRAEAELRLSTQIGHQIERPRKRAALTLRAVALSAGTLCQRTSGAPRARIRVEVTLSFGRRIFVRNFIERNYLDSRRPKKQNGVIAKIQNNFDAPFLRQAFAVEFPRPL